MPETLGDLQYTVRVDFTEADAGLANYDKKVQAKRKQWERPIKMQFDGRSGTGGGGGNGGGGGRGGRDVERDYNLRESAARAERVQRNWDQAQFAQFRMEERAAQRLARAREKAAAAMERDAAKILNQDGQDDSGGKGGNGGTSFLGLRMGRLAQYATIGFAALEASRIASAYQQRGIGEMLAGRNQIGRLAAEEAFSDAITATPIVGPLAGYIAGAPEAKAFDEASVQSSNADDALSASRSKFREYGRAQGERGEIAALGDNTFEGQRLSFEFDRSRTVRNNFAEKVQLAKAFNDQQDQEQVRLAATVEDAKRFDRPENDYNSPEKRAAQAQLDAFANSRMSDRRTFSQKLDADTAANDSAANAVASEQNRKLDAVVSATNILARTNIGSSLLSAGHDPFGAQVNSILGDTQAKEKTADAGQKLNIMFEGLATLADFFAETGRNLKNEASDIKSKTLSSGLARSGFTYAASVESINQSRQQQLRALPDNWFYNNVLGGNALRGAINQNANQDIAVAGDAEQRRDITAVSRNASLSARLLNRPLDAQLAEIQGGFDTRNVGRSNLSPASIEDRIGTMLEKAIARKDNAFANNQIGLSLDTQKQQIAAGMRRDIIGEQVAGIKGAGLEQFNELRQAGRPVGLQRESLQNSIGSLNLLKQNYLDAFRGQQTDLRFINTQNRKDSEDPIAVLKEINTAVGQLIQQLNTLTSS